MIKQIVAVDKNYGIGYQGDLLFPNMTDMKYFRSLTIGDKNLPDYNYVVMGRKTYESLPLFPLKQRDKFVITKSLTDEPTKLYEENFTIFTQDLEALVDSYKNNWKQDIKRDMWIIGGSQIYDQTLEHADEVYITHIDAEAKDCDTWYNFDKLLDYFEIDDSYTYEAFDEDTGLTMKFAKYVRK